MDLSPLRGEFTFGLNRVYLLFDRIGFATTFLVAINQLVAEQFVDDILAVESDKFLSWPARRYVADRRSVTFLRPTRGPRFSRDVRSGIWGGATVTYAAMQLAYHMGFSEAILIGVDHSFATSGEPHKMIVSKGADPNHFDAGYFGKGIRWELPNLELSEVAYRLARNHWEADRRRIVDATVGGKLTVFPKVSFEQIVRGV